MCGVNCIEIGLLLLTRCFSVKNWSLGDAEQIPSDAFSIVSHCLCCTDRCLESNQQYPELFDLEFTEMKIGKCSEGQLISSINVDSHLNSTPLHFVACH